MWLVRKVLTLQNSLQSLAPLTIANALSVTHHDMSKE